MSNSNEDEEEKIDELDVSGNVVPTNQSMGGTVNNSNNNNNRPSDEDDDDDYDDEIGDETGSRNQKIDRLSSAPRTIFGGNDLSAYHADVEVVLERCQDVLNICNQVVDVNVKSIPHFRDALMAFVQNLNSQIDTIKEFTGLNEMIDNNLRSCTAVLVESHKLLVDVQENSSSIFFRKNKYKNKIRQCQTNLQGIENRLFNAVHAELFSMNNNELVNMNSQLTRNNKNNRLNNSYKNSGRQRSSSNISGVRKTQAEEWCMTADRYYSGLGVSQSYEIAFRNYLRAAKSGLVRAMNCIGCMYQYGRGIPEDPKEAEHWFREACNLNDPDGMNNLAMLLEDKIGNSLDDFLNRNSEETQIRLGGISQSSSYVPQKMREIEQLFLNAAEQGHLDAMNNLGRLYEYADIKGRASISRSYSKAFEWYENAANQGYSKGQVNLGSMYYSGRGLSAGPSYEMAAKLFRKAADQGDPIAQNNLGICYEMGRGVPKDYLAASELYEKSAKLGNPSGMNNWGYMLVRQAESVGGGEDAPQYVQAVDLFRAAIAAGDALDSEKIQTFSSRPLHSHKKYAGAARKRDRIEMGHCSADACFNLATLYEAGYGVTRDLPAAFMYYVKAADYPGRPHTRAASRAGAMLYSGSGCRRNFQSAKKYYLKAASKGDADAENALGIMIEEGLGNNDPEMRGIGDPKKAAVWYRRAGQQGNLYALLNLARLHVRGQGVEKSITFAKHLLDRAADNGLHEARIERARLNSLRDENIEDVHSYLGQIDFAEHEFDLDLIRESGRRAQEAALRAASKFDDPSNNVTVTSRNVIMSSVRETKEEIDRQVRFDNRLQETRLNDPPPGIRPANVMENEDARMQNDSPRMNISPSGKSLISSSFNNNNISATRNIRRKQISSNGKRLPPPPPGVRSASMIEADMSNDDLNRLRELQQTLDENHSPLISRFDESNGTTRYTNNHNNNDNVNNDNNNNDNQLEEIQSLHHELESFNSSFNTSNGNIYSGAKLDKNKLPPPPPGIHSATSNKNIFDYEKSNYNNINEISNGTPKRASSQLKHGIIGSMYGDVANTTNRQSPPQLSSPTLPPRTSSRNAPTSPNLPPRQLQEEPELPPRNLGNTKPITPRRSKKLIQPRNVQKKINELKEKLLTVIEAYGDDSLDAALLYFRLGKAYQKIVEQNCKLVPDDPTYSIGIADAEDCFTQSLNIRLTELGPNDPLCH